MVVWRSGIFLGVVAVRLSACLALTIFAVLLATSASYAARVALLIGNSEYGSAAASLRNPVNDASGLAEALEPLGFDVTVVLNGEIAEIEAAVTKFGQDAAGAELALFYFAGHGVQIDGRNFLLSSSFRHGFKDVVDQSLRLDAVRDALDAAAPGIGVVVLDACRDNIYGERDLSGLARSRFGARTLVAYATDPDNVASDGAGSHSPFTEGLIQHLATPSLDVRLMFGRVRQHVALQTDGDQVPWVEESVIGEHYFNPAPRDSRADPEIEGDVAAWEAASAQGGVEAYQAYLRDFPEGLFAGFAEERIEGLAAAEPKSDTSSFAITDEDREQLTFALSTLGFLPRTRGQAVVEDAELRVGLTSYEEQMAGGPIVSADEVYLDAAQVMVVLGSTTAQRIRTDMAALKSIDIVLGMAVRAYSELQGLDDTNANVKAALAVARDDLQAVDAARSRVLDRLDESRAYYAGLVERGRQDFQPYLERSMAALLEKSRSVPAFESSIVSGADTFIRHASAQDQPEGSYAWIADFLPQQ